MVMYQVMTEEILTRKICETRLQEKNRTFRSIEKEIKIWKAKISSIQQQINRY